MAKTNCGTCNTRGYSEEHQVHIQTSHQVEPYATHCNTGCTCKRTTIDGTFNCVPKRAQQSRDRYLNAGGFLGTGVSGFKVIWWSLGALLLLAVVGKGVKIYKQAKY